MSRKTTAVAAGKQDRFTVPEGYALVPVNATREMIDAARRVEEDGYDAMLKAMIAAAPKPQDPSVRTELAAADWNDDKAETLSRFERAVSRTCDVVNANGGGGVVAEWFFTLMMRYGLIGDYSLGIQKSASWPEDRTMLDSQELFENALESVFTELYDSHLSRLSGLGGGGVSDPWFLLDERQEIRDILHQWDEAGFIEYSLDHFDERKRGVRVLRDDLTPIEHARPRG